MMRSTRVAAFLAALAGLAGGLALGGGGAGAAPPAAGDGVVMGRYQATPPTMAANAPMDLLMGPRAEVVIGTSAFSSVRVQGTTEDGAALLTSEDAPVLVAGVDPDTGLVQRIMTDDAGNVAVTTSAAGAGAAVATTPRYTQATDDLVPLATTTDAGAASARLMAVGGVDPDTGLAQRVATDDGGNVAITTSAAGAGAVVATTPRLTLASDDPAVTSLSIIDDWDEANRAAVNPIAGQVGVQAAAGVATALTQRVTQATDDLVPAATTTDGGATSARLVTVGGVDPSTGLAQTIATSATGGVVIVDSGGSLTVDGTVAIAPGARVLGMDADGALVTSDPVLVAGVDESTGLVQRIAVSSTGAVAIQDSGGVITVGGTASALQQGGGAIGADVLRVTQATDDLVPLATTTDGGAASTRVVTVGGFDGANAQQLLTAASGALRVDPTGTTAQPVTDNAGSLTVDAPVGTPLFARLSDGAAAAGTLANPLFTRLSDGVEGINVTAANELNVLATAQPGVDVGDVTVNNAAGAAAVNVQDGGNVLSVDDAAGSLTVDNGTLAVVGAGLEATALRVTLASDSTGLVSVDDNAGSLTVDTPQLPAALVGGRLDVVVGAALPAGAANIGDVDVLTMPADATELPAAAALADGAANPTTPTIGAAGLLFNDAGTWDRASGDTLAAYVQGPTAADGAIAARPVTVGGRASTAAPAGVSADGDVVDAWHTRRGAAVTTGGVTAYVMSSTLAGNLQAQAANTGLRLVLVTVQETAGATAQLYVIHGTLESDTRLIPVRCAANESVIVHLPGGLSADSGVFIDWVSGAMSVTIGTEDQE